jgi:hypothetical protein
MVRIIPPDIIQVIVLAGYSQAFLGVGCPGIWPVICSQEDILKLHHARIGEQQSLVPTRYQGCRSYKAMAVGNKKINEAFPYFRTALHHKKLSRSKFILRLDYKPSSITDQ